jgi:hypothetical protein
MSSFTFTCQSQQPEDVEFEGLLPEEDVEVRAAAEQRECQLLLRHALE